MLDGDTGFHNHESTYEDLNSEFWVSVIFPSDETLLVKKMDLQKRGDGGYPLNTISNIRLKYLSENDEWIDYMDGADIPTGQTADDTTNFKREILFSDPMLAKQVKVYFLCDGSTGEHY